MGVDPVRIVKSLNRHSLTTEKAIKVNVPIIKECIAHLECRLVKSTKTGDHTLIIGQIVVAYTLAGYFEEVYNLAKFRPCLHLGKTTSQLA